MSDIETTVAPVLAEHQRKGYRCTCGWEVPPGEALADAHFAHVAAKVAEALAGPAPEGDDREALARLIRDWTYPYALDGWVDLNERRREPFLKVADAVLAAGFRRGGVR